MTETMISKDAKAPARARPWTVPAFWCGTSVYLVLIIAFGWHPSPFAHVLGLIGVTAAFFHASLIYGWRAALAFFLICNAISFSMENLSIATGFPFGRYHFAFGQELPWIGAVPILIGPFWFVMGYWSWCVANILLQDNSRAGGWRSLIAMPLAAALIMTQWDMVMDAPNATVAGSWVWHDGGAFFGVPVSNYLGWILNSWAFFTGFALYLAYAKRQPADFYRRRGLGLFAVLFYLSAGATNLVPLLLGQAGEVADGSGRVWQVREIYEAAALMMAMTMGVTGLQALLRLYEEPSGTISKAHRHQTYN
jgi:uncharacterized membrane protein